MILRRRALALLSLLATIFYLFHHLPTRQPHTPSPLTTIHEETIEEAYKYFGFARGISIFQPDNYTKDLVLPCTPKDDVSWLSAVPPWLNLIPKVYHVPMTSSSTPPPGALRVPKNKGNEAMAYLTYVIHHYDTLPDLVIFTHASNTAWHNNDMHMFSTALMLRELNYHRAARLGFMNLRCHWDPGCPSWIKPHNNRYTPDKGEEMYFHRDFRKLFPGVRLPETLASACCAQFVVTRERIRGNTREEYIRWREWLLHTDLVDRYSGRIMEYLWHYIFSDRNNRTTAVCPSEYACYCDGYGMCFGSEETYRKHLASGKDAADIEKQLKQYVEEGPKKGEDMEVREDIMRQMKKRIDEAQQVLMKEIDIARERGRDAEVRRREVGVDEFTEKRGSFLG